jgi:hypothetical protein
VCGASFCGKKKRKNKHTKQHSRQQSSSRAEQLHYSSRAQQAA